MWTTQARLEVCPQPRTETSCFSAGEGQRQTNFEPWIHAYSEDSCLAKEIFQKMGQSQTGPSLMV